MQKAPTNARTGGFPAFLLILVLAILALGVMNMPDRRTTGERVGDAIDALPQGADKAARQLERRTPGEKMGDAVKDVGEDIKKNSQP